MTQTPNSSLNPLGLEGIEFVEFASPKPEALDKLFGAFGFSRTMHHALRAIDYYNQGDIHFLLNRDPRSFAAGFQQSHGPSIPAMGWRVADAARAVHAAIERGAELDGGSDYEVAGRKVPALKGIGGSRIYLIDHWQDPQRYQKLGFAPHPHPLRRQDFGFLAIDHLTNNVPQGTMGQWSDFYRKIFGFTEVRYFDIRGARTGLVSYALRSPCGTFCIPINEGTEAKSQINEYLEEYRGAGIQHLAFTTKDIVSSLKGVRQEGVETLEIDAEYYQEVFKRVPGVTEDKAELERLNILVDGDDKGYLLQIFTRNLIGPIFIEIIQRKNHNAFGEGNFGALFRSLERDQERRGVFTKG